MDDTDFQKALLQYTIHIADNQTRIAEAMATLGQQMTALGLILERITRTTDRTEQMVARILASVGEE